MATWWTQFKCWIVFGHKWSKTGDSSMMTQEMDTCVFCGKYEAGPDGWH